MYRSEIDEEAKTLKLGVRRKPGKLVCSGCGRAVAEIAEVSVREVRDLACFGYRTTIVVELYRVRCPDCGIKAEKIDAGTVSDRHHFYRLTDSGRSEIQK